MQVWVLRSTGVLAVWEPLQAACSRESLRGGFGVSSPVCDAYCSASEPCLGIHLGLDELAQAVTGAPRLERAGASLWRSLTAPLPRSQVLGSGAKVRVRPSSSAWATAAALGAEVGWIRVALRVGVDLGRRQWWVFTSAGAQGGIAVGWRWGCSNLRCWVQIGPS